MASQGADTFMTHLIKAGLYDCTDGVCTRTGIDYLLLEDFYLNEDDIINGKNGNDTYTTQGGADTFLTYIGYAKDPDFTPNVGDKFLLMWNAPSLFNPSEDNPLIFTPNEDHPHFQ